MWLAINIFHKNLLFFCFVSIRVFPSQTIDYRNNCNFNMVNGDLWIVFIAFVGQFMDAILIEHSLINVNNFVWRVIGTSFSIERSHKIINSFCEKKMTIYCLNHGRLTMEYSLYSHSMTDSKKNWIKNKCWKNFDPTVDLLSKNFCLQFCSDVIADIRWKH